jgi:hypothetical protein
VVERPGPSPTERLVDIFMSALTGLMILLVLAFIVFIGIVSYNLIYNPDAFHGKRTTVTVTQCQQRGEQ